MFTGKLSFGYFKTCVRMEQLVRDPPTKPVNLSSIPQDHMEGKNQPPQSSIVKNSKQQQTWTSRKQMTQFKNRL